MNLELKSGTREYGFRLTITQTGQTGGASLITANRFAQVDRWSVTALDSADCIGHSRRPLNSIMKRPVTDIHNLLHFGRNFK